MRTGIKKGIVCIGAISMALLPAASAALAAPAYEAEPYVDISIRLTGFEDRNYEVGALVPEEMEAVLTVSDRQAGIASVFYSVEADGQGWNYQIPVCGAGEHETSPDPSAGYENVQQGSLQEWDILDAAGEDIYCMSRTVYVYAGEYASIRLAFTDRLGRLFSYQENYLVGAVETPQELLPENGALLPEDLPESAAEPESEVQSEPEPEPASEVQPEPESPAEPESDTWPEPEPEPEGLPEILSYPEEIPESAAEPESEVQSESEPEPEGLPEILSYPEEIPESAAEPESEARPESEPGAEDLPEDLSYPEAVSESAAEPESEAESEPEPESPAEPESEVQPETEPESEAQPESEAEPESLPEGLSYPEEIPESVSEPESEEQVESVPEPASEVQPETEPESEVQPESEAEPESLPEVLSYPEEIPESVPGPESESQPETEPASWSSYSQSPSYYYPTSSYSRSSGGTYRSSGSYSSGTYRNSSSALATSQADTQTAPADADGEDPASAGEEKMTAPGSTAASGNDGQKDSPKQMEQLSGGSVYDLSPIEKYLGKYLQSAPDLVIYESNTRKIDPDTVRVVVFRNGEMAELEKDVDYHFKLTGSSADQKIYKYTIQKNVFQEDGSYRVCLFSEDADGNQNSNEASDAQIGFHIDTVSPLILSVEPTKEQARSGLREIRIKDDTQLADIEIYLGNRQVEFEEDGETYRFPVSPDEEEKDVKVVAKDQAGNSYERILTGYVEAGKAKTRAGIHPASFLVLAGAGIVPAFLVLRKRKKKRTPGRVR